MFRFYPEGKGHLLEGLSSGAKWLDLYFRKTTKGFWKHEENGLRDKIEMKEAT